VGQPFVEHSVPSRDQFQCVPIVRGNASWVLDPRFYAEEPRVARAVVIHTHTQEATMARGALLWLLGVPIPIIILLFLFWH
jgi:hypothetical protein